MDQCLAGVKDDKDYIKHLIEVEAIHQGVSPKLAIGVATVESSLNPNARGAKGEIGLFQLLPATLEPKKSRLLVNNIRRGIREIAYWQKNCPTKDQETFVICYNQGYHHPKYPLLHPYYKKVMQAMR